MKVLTPMKAIRAKCLDCCVGPLYPYRLGHRPKKDIDPAEDKK